MERDDSFELKPGDVLAEKFRIEQVLGVGGMGIVAAAWHLELRTRVALKVLLPGAQLDAAAVERFAREASAVSRMRSEYVVRVFDVGKLPDGGPPYIVMEHLEGQDLDSALETRGALPVEEAVGYLLQACEGIAEAHSLGIIHRDLKPGNLFLTRRVDGTTLLKVVDFGIAKQTTVTGSTLTGPLIAMGSPHYMSPEQTRAAHDVEAATDIWSLGICLYEMLTGVTPFDAPSVAEVIALVLMGVPKSPTEVRADLPPRLAEIVMRCLAKKPEDRFRSVAELAKALEEFAPSAARGAADRMQLVLDNGVARPPMAESPPQELAERTAAELEPAIEARPKRSPPPKRRAVSARLAALGLVVVGVVVLALVWRAATMRRAAALAAASATPSSMASADATDGGVTSDQPIAIQTGKRQPNTTTLTPRAGTPRTSAHGGKPGRGIARAFPESEPEPAAPISEPTTTAVAAASPEPAPPLAAPAPRFAIATARVEVGSATNTIGTTAGNVNRVIGPLGEKMTACYRAALPKMPDPASGSGTLHIETDEEGVITVARVLGSISAPSACIAASASGKKLPNVDTGRVRADIPLVFKAQ